MRPFWIALAAGLLGASPQDLTDRSPVDLALSPDGRWALTANSTSDSAALVDLVEGKVADACPAGKRPFAVAWRNGLAVLTNFLDETVTILDVAPPRISAHASLHVGYQPRGVAIAGDRAFVALSGEDAVAVVDLKMRRLAGTIPVGVEPWHVAATPDGSRVVVGNARSMDVRLIDAASLKVVRTVPVGGRNLRHLAISPDGAWAYLPQIVDGLGPTTIPGIEQGKVLRNQLVRIPLTTDGPREAMALDARGFASGDLDGVALSPDGQTIALSVSGTRTLALLRAPWPFAESPKDHMTEEYRKDEQHYRRVLGVRGRPLGIAWLPDGKRIVVANALLNSLQFVDVEKADVAGSIGIGGPPQPVSLERKGEAIFYDAYRGWHEWFSCATCHVEGHENGGLYDTFNDGKYGNPKRVLSLRGVAKTGPWTWHGRQTNLSQSVQGSLTRTMNRGAAQPEDLKALLAYLETLDFVPPPQASKTEAAKRGEAVFKSRDCDSCHAPPYYMDRETHVVGLEAADDVYKGFNPPSLRGVGRRAPFLHDGRAKTLEELLEKHHTPEKLSEKPALAPNELADLVAFLKSL